MRVDTSLAPLPAKRFGTRAARHLLRRAGFGGGPAEVAALRDRGRDGAIRHLLAYRRIAADNLPAPPVNPDVVRPLTREERRARRVARKTGDREALERIRAAYRRRRRRDRRMFRDLQQWWLEVMLETPRPMEEKLTLLWHDHFATGYRSVRDAYLLFQQNRMLRRHAAGNFQTLAKRIVRDPAMIKYLDNHRNRKGHPNENLARELMELFTLGEGQYTERDIKEAARALTGYGFRDNGFRFRHELHDHGMKRILGRRGRFDGDDLVRILLKREACSQWLAYKLYNHFVADVPAAPERIPSWARRVILDLAALLRRHDYALEPVLATLLRSRHFYEPRIVGQKIKSPAQLLVGAMREIDAPPRSSRALIRAMRGMGQRLFQPPSVAGWDGGRAWITTSTLFVRQNACAYLITGRHPVGGREQGQPYDPSPLLAALPSRDPEAVAHALIDALIGEAISRARREPVIRFARDKGPRLANDDVVGLLVLIMAMPEYQLC